MPQRLYSDTFEDIHTANEYGFTSHYKDFVAFLTAGLFNHCLSLLQTFECGLILFPCIYI